MDLVRQAHDDNRRGSKSSLANNEHELPDEVSRVGRVVNSITQKILLR